jgi:AcrR family transcriptional regulator
VSAAKTRRKGSEIRSLILGAAREQFASGGYQGTTTRQIAATADVSERLIYFHFTSKAMLFEQAIVEPLLAFMEQFADDWRGSAGHPHELEDVAREWIGGMYDLMRKHRRLVLALLTAGQYEAEVADVLSGRSSPLARIHELTEEIMAAEARDRGYEGLDLRLTVRMPFAMLLAAAVLDGPVFAGMRRPNRDAIVNEMTGLAVHGASGRAPTKQA